MHRQLQEEKIKLSDEGGKDTRRSISSLKLLGATAVFCVRLTAVDGRQAKKISIPDQSSEKPELLAFFQQVGEWIVYPALP